MPLYHRDRQTDRQRGRQADRQTDRQTDRDRQKERGEEEEDYVYDDNYETLLLKNKYLSAKRLRFFFFQTR